MMIAATPSDCTASARSTAPRSTGKRRTSHRMPRLKGTQVIQPPKLKCNARDQAMGLPSVSPIATTWLANITE